MLSWLDPGGPEQPWLIAAAGLTIVVGCAVIAYALFRDTPEWVTLGGVVSACLVVDLLRAGTGSIGSYTSLLFAPVVWQAMQRSRPYVWWTVVLVGLANLYPVAAAEGASERAAQARSSVIFLLVAVTVAWSVHHVCRRGPACCAGSPPWPRPIPLTACPTVAAER